jgi:hypothetical protein
MHEIIEKSTLQPKNLLVEDFGKSSGMWHTCRLPAAKTKKLVSATLQLPLRVVEAYLIPFPVNGQNVWG